MGYALKSDIFEISIGFGRLGALATKTPCNSSSKSEIGTSYLFL